MCMNACVRVCYYMCMHCWQRPEEGIRFPLTEVIDDVEPPCEYREPNQVL